MSPNVKICPHCGEETLRPYELLPDNEHELFFETWVCTKCYNSVEFVFDRNKQIYVNKK